MNVKSILAASVVATLPMAASAALVTIQDGGSTLITGMGDTYQFVVETNAGDFKHTFTVASDAEGVAAVSLNQLIAPFFSGVSVQWIANGAVVASGTDGDLVTTDFVTPGSATQDLLITWADAPADSEFDGAVTISAVPVPAGLLLMGTALAGLGFMRRKS